ncbi:MAG: GFA family protein [Steroidobacteraceae bacterium]
MRDINGSCLCGQIRYSAKVEPAFVAVCHCKNCQKQAGTAFSVLVAVPKSSLSIQGRLKTFQDVGDSGQAVLRNFCPDCGSPITSDVAVMPELVFIKAGTLEDTSWLDPKMHVYCDSAQRWTPLPEGSQTFAKMPG